MSNQTQYPEANYENVSNGLVTITDVPKLFWNKNVPAKARAQALVNLRDIVAGYDGDTHTATRIRWAHDEGEGIVCQAAHIAGGIDALLRIPSEAKSYYIDGFVNFKEELAHAAITNDRVKEMLQKLSTFLVVVNEAEICVKRNRKSVGYALRTTLVGLADSKLTVDSNNHPTTIGVFEGDTDPSLDAIIRNDAETAGQALVDADAVGKSFAPPAPLADQGINVRSDYGNYGTTQLTDDTEDEPQKAQRVTYYTPGNPNGTVGTLDEAIAAAQQALENAQRRKSFGEAKTEEFSPKESDGDTNANNGKDTAKGYITTTTTTTYIIDEKTGMLTPRGSHHYGESNRPIPASLRRMYRRLLVGQNDTVEFNEK